MENASAKNNKKKRIPDIVWGISLAAVFTIAPLLIFFSPNLLYRFAGWLCLVAAIAKVVVCLKNRKDNEAVECLLAGLFLIVIIFFVYYSPAKHNELVADLAKDSKDFDRYAQMLFLSPHERTTHGTYFLPDEKNFWMFSNEKLEWIKENMNLDYLFFCDEVGLYKTLQLEKEKQAVARILAERIKRYDIVKITFSFSLGSVMIFCGFIFEIVLFTLFSRGFISSKQDEKDENELETIP